MAWEDLSLSSSKARPKRKGPNLQRLRGSHLSRNQDSKASNKLPVMSPQEFGLQIHCPGDKNGRVFFQEKKSMHEKKDVCECSQCPTFRNPYTTGWCVESEKDFKKHQETIPCCQVASCTWGEAAGKLQHRGERWFSRLVNRICWQIQKFPPTKGDSAGLIQIVFVGFL